MTHSVIRIVPYDPNWPAQFESEALLIQKALGENCLMIHHIGSTSIPGISAKPIIDILPVVKNILEVDRANEAMQDIGYEAKGEHGIAFRRYFQKGSTLRTHNVHVFQEGDSEIERYLNFRNWMRSHPEDAQAYSQLKSELAQRYSYDIISYCSGKDAFVASIDAKDGYQGWRIVKVLTDAEKEAMQTFRKQLSSTEGSAFNAEESESNSIHFVLYKEAQIIGYAHLQFWQENAVIVRALIVEKAYEKFGMRELFLSQCERWISHQNYTRST